MGRLVVGVLVVALLVGLVWLERDGEAGRAASPGPDSLRAAAPPAELDSPAATAETPAAGLPMRAIEGEASHREPSAPAPDAARDDLVVRAVDPAGAPVSGIPLQLERGANEPSRHDPGRLVTDANGRARFPGMRPALETAAEPWALRFELPFEEPPRLALDRATLAPREVVAVLPWGGTVDVVVQEIGGSAAPEGSKVRLRLVRDEERASPVLKGPEWSSTTVADRTSFPWVELGRTWEVSAWRPGGSVPTRSRVPGPRAGREVVRVAIELGSDHPVVSFRAVDPGAKPIASAAITVAQRQVFAFTSTTRVVTDEAGRFTVDGAPPSSPDRRWLAVTYTSPDGSVLEGRAWPPESLAIGWNDGGDVVLESERALCTGRVVDQSRNGVPGARVTAGTVLDSRSQRKVGGTTDEQGRFELRGLVDDDKFYVRAEQGALRSEAVRANRGDRDLELVLSPRWTITGRLTTDPGIDPGSVQFEVEAPDAAPRAVKRKPVQLVFRNPLEHEGVSLEKDEDGRFELEPVLAGEYALRCVLNGAELARVERVSVHQDTDVGTIDLRGRVLVCEIELLGAGTDELAGEAVWWIHGSGQQHRVGIDSILVRILTPTVPIDVSVRPRGYRSARLTDVSGRRELVLEPPLSVRLVLHTGGEFPETPFVLRCQLQQDGVDVGVLQGSPYLTGEDREIAFLVSVAGRVRVHWLLERQVDGAGFGGRTLYDALEGHDVVIDVQDVAAEQVFPIELDGAALTALARDPSRSR